MPVTDPLAHLARATTALVLVDLQEKLLPAVVDSERVTRATRLLLRAAHVLKLPVIATTQYRKGLGEVVAPVEELIPMDAARLDKTAFSCFDDARFDDVLRRAAPGAATLLVAGIETHICVAGTVLGALRRGYGVEIVTDAVSSRATSDHEVGLKRMERAGTLPTTAEMAIYELLGGSSSAEFKALLPYFKEASA